jgi:hypothetical protein
VWVIDFTNNKIEAWSNKYWGRVALCKKIAIAEHKFISQSVKRALRAFQKREAQMRKNGIIVR